MDDEFGIGEFRAPDDEMIKYVLDTSTLLKQFSADLTLEHYRREVLKTSSHTMKVMLAMAIGGYHLYCLEGDHASALADLSTVLYDRLALTDPKQIEDINIEPLLKFRSYRETGVNLDDIPFFGDRPD